MSSDADQHQVPASWREAGRDLGVRVEAPYVLDTPTGGVEFLAYLPDFGSRRGMVLCRLGGVPMEDVKQVPAAQAAGLYYSSLNTAAYSTYNRASFIATLDDWGYFGPTDQTPSWYTGQAWGRGDDVGPRPSDA